MRCLLILLILAAPLAARDIHVADIAAWPAALAAAQPGDNLILGEGEWRDARVAFNGQATEASPTTYVVWLGHGREGGNQIDRNYFGPRAGLGANGGETIRIGDSRTSMLAANCVVEKNLFEKCNGEVECISNKSCGNIYRDNTFL